MSSEFFSNFVETKLGLPGNTVRLAPYCSDWPVLFAAEKQRISEALSSVSHCIEHIGSTAVPGLSAKPVIDIMVGVTSQADMQKAEALMTCMTYVAKGEKGVPGRLFLTHGDPCTIHVHITELHSAFWVEHILFRDQLREKQRIADDYVAIKAHLARLFPNDRDSYTRGKADFIEDVLANARRVY